MKLPDKDQTHEDCNNPQCICGHPQELLEKLEGNPNYMKELQEVEDIIQKRMQEIKEERKRRF